MSGQRLAEHHVPRGGRTRTREHILSVFNRQFLSSGREDVRIGEVIAEARIGRSTFYDHFAGRDELWRAALSRPFGLLAGAAIGEIDAGELADLLNHFWVNRAKAPIVFAGAKRERSLRVLADLIEERLEDQGTPLRLPRALAATQMAEMLFAPIYQWMCGAGAISSEKLAASLCRSCAVLRTALLDD